MLSAADQFKAVNRWRSVHRQKCYREASAINLVTMTCGEIVAEDQGCCRDVSRGPATEAVVTGGSTRVTKGWGGLVAG